MVSEMPVLSWKDPFPKRIPLGQYRIGQDKLFQFSQFPLVDYGESEAILLCKETNSDYLIIDDKRAREVAEEIGIECIGTIGILFRAKGKGFIKELRPLFLEFIENDRYYSKLILNEILKKAKEQKID